MSRPLPSRYKRSSALVRASWPDAMLPSLTLWLRIICCRRSTVSPVSVSFMTSVCRAAPVLLDLEVRGQARDLGAGLRRVRLDGAGLQQERCGAAAHELAAHREDEVAA